MDNIKLDFEQAKAKHLLFKSKLRSILYGAELDEAPVLSHFECTVGKWIYSHALKAYGHLPEMQDLEKVHADIHTSARELVKLYKEGKVDQARQGLEGMEKIADNLVGLLAILENKLITNPESKITSENYQGLEITEKELRDLLIANEQLDKTIKEQSGELLKERQVLHNFFMQAPAILAILKGPTHIFELANPPYIELIGNRNPVGKTVKEALPEIEGQGFFELLDNVYKTGETFIGTEVPVSLLRNGKLEELFVNFSYQAYKNAKGETEGILVFAYDVSEQVKARNIVIESTAKTKFMGEAMPQKVWTTDAEGNADYYNQHWVDFTGKSFDELYKWGWVDIIHPDDLENNLKVWKESINTGVDFQLEHRFRRRDGQYRWHLSRGVPQKNEDGKVIRWVGTSTDIHDLKTVQEELKRSYEDLEVKVKFRNIELERKVMELQKENSILSNSKK